MVRSLPQHPRPWLSALRRPSLLYPLGLCVFIFSMLLRWPIIVGDTDVWFHLDYGKYLFEHHTIPSSSFFSFVSPPATFVLHSWLFEAFLWLFYSSSGYVGLIILRSVLYLATVSLVLRYLLRAHEDQQSHAWVAFLFTLCSIVLIPRYLLVRPHIFTYTFIMVFLYILEHRPRHVLFLPVLGLLWCNLHGVTYPVMLLLLLSYIAEYFLRRLRGHAYSRGDDRSFLAPLVLTMLTIFLTPHHLRLLPLPFLPAGYEASFTQELLPLSLSQLTSFDIWGMTPTVQTLFNVLLFTTGIVVMVSCARRQVRLSHVLLCLGGAVLLWRGARFMDEFALLSLPIIARRPGERRETPGHLRPRFVVVFVSATLMIMPVLLLKKIFANRPAYPLSHRNLPLGVVTFLNQLDVGGNILNNPGTGGYFRWMLYPRYRIFRDMELFAVDSFHLALHAFGDKEALRKVLTRYDPSFISVPLQRGQFRKLIQSFPEYVVVFFDDAEVLYLNARHHPGLARSYALQGLDPFGLVGRDADAVLADEHDREVLMRQVRGLLEVYPGGGITNQIVALTYNQEGAYDRALPYAERIIQGFPDMPLGYVLKGDSLTGLGVLDQALATYRLALERIPLGGRATLEKKLGRLLLQTYQYEQAYRVLKSAVDVFAPETSLEDAYQFGLAAQFSGHRKIAEAIFVFLYEYKIAPEDTAWAAKFRTELAHLGIDRDGL